jgi:hypothetical protein
MSLTMHLHWQVYSKNGQAALRAGRLLWASGIPDTGL